MVRVSRGLMRYRVLTAGSQGWRGIPDGSWVIQEDSAPRPILPPGQVKPDVTNTGVTSSRARTAQMGDVTLTNPNQVYRDIDFFGKVTAMTTGLKFYNCGFYGTTAWPLANSTLVDCRVGTEGAASTIEPWWGIPYFEDCTFRPQRPSYYMDGITGSYHLKRCKFEKVRTACIINSTSDTRPARVRIENSLIRELVYWQPIAGVAGGTVNHGIDILSAGYIYIAGNLIEASAVLGDDRNFPDADGPIYPSGRLSGRHPNYRDHMNQNGSHANGAGLRVMQTRALAFDSNTVIEKNWFAQGMIGADLVQGTYAFRDNKFKRNGFYQTSNGVRYYIRLRFSQAATIVGLNTNTFEDNGEILTMNNRGLQV